MNNKITELVMILDRSGSMYNLSLDTIGGFNSLIKKQKKEEGNTLVTTILFDDKVEILHNRVDIKNVEEITEKDYFTRGSTALLDAMGETITGIENSHKFLKESEIPSNVLVVIITDGLENASRKYNQKQVKELVEMTKKKGYEYIFLGADLDTVETAESYGIGRDRAMTYSYSREGIKDNFNIINEMAYRMKSEKLMEEVFDIRDILKKSNDNSINNKNNRS